MSKGVTKSLTILMLAVVLSLHRDSSEPAGLDTALFGPTHKKPQTAPRDSDKLERSLQLSPTPLPGSAEFPSESEIRRLFREAKFTEALRLSQQQISSATLSEAHKSWLKAQIPTLQLGQTWQWIRAGKCDDALEILESLTNSNQAALAWKGLGYCSLKRKDYYSAQQYLQQYLQLKGKDPEAYLLLAEAEEAIGSFETALELTEKASSLDNLREEEQTELKSRENKLTAKIAELPTQGEISSGFFTIRYQARDSHLFIQQSINILQNHVHFLVQQLGFEYPEQPIEVIFHLQNNFSKASHGPSWATAIYDGRIRIPVRDNQITDERFTRILRHELTHAMLSEQARHQSLPHWFHEGLAQYSECENFCRTYPFAATSQKFLDMQIFDSNFSSLTEREAGVAYRQSLYLLLTLTQSTKYYGLAGLKQMIQALPTIESYSSNELLRQIGSDFSQLYLSASRLWEDQRSF